MMKCSCPFCGSKTDLLKMLRDLPRPQFTAGKFRRRGGDSVVVEFRCQKCRCVLTLTGERRIH